MLDNKTMDMVRNRLEQVIGGTYGDWIFVEELPAETKNKKCLFAYMPTGLEVTVEYNEKVCWVNSKYARLYHDQRVFSKYIKDRITESITKAVAAYSAAPRTQEILDCISGNIVRKLISHNIYASMNAEFAEIEQDNTSVEITGRILVLKYEQDLLNEYYYNYRIIYEIGKYPSFEIVTYAEWDKSVRKKYGEEVLETKNLRRPTDTEVETAKNAFNSKFNEIMASKDSVTTKTPAEQKEMVYKELKRILRSFRREGIDFEPKDVEKLLSTEMLACVS